MSRYYLVFFFVSVVLICHLSLSDASRDKFSWPELVGESKENARAAIHRQRPNLRIQILRENQPATMDYRLDRVRIFINGAGRVVMAPRVG